MKKKIWIIIAIIVILLGIGTYFLFSGGSQSSSNQQYQTPNTTGTSAAQYSGLDLTPGQSQTDAVPSASTDIPAP